MGHEMAEGFSGFCMQTSLSLSLYNTPSRVVLRAKEAVHTLLPTPCLHGCMSWEGFASPMFPHSQVLRKINHSLFL